MTKLKLHIYIESWVSGGRSEINIYGDWNILSPLCLPISPRGLLDFALLYLYSFITQLVKRKQINLVYDWCTT